MGWLSGSRPQLQSPAAGFIALGIRQLADRSNPSVLQNKKALCQKANAFLWGGGRKEVRNGLIEIIETLRVYFLETKAPYLNYHHFPI
jgi:hypothetical protein